MTDHMLKAELRKFIADRDWGRFHTPENLAKSISIEAAELLEEFQWGNPETLENVRLELADVLTYCYMLADKIGEDPESLILEKLEITRAKYPVAEFKGSSRKYSK